MRRDAADGPAMRMHGMAAPDDPVRLDLSRGTPDPLLLPPLGPALSRVSARADVGSYQAEPVRAQQIAKQLQIEFVVLDNQDFFGHNRVE